MPRGWYLAQGLVPLGYDSSDDDEGPCELPNGRLVCGPHGLVICPRCCSDYSFMDDILDEEEDDDDDDEDEAEDEDIDEDMGKDMDKDDTVFEFPHSDIMALRRGRGLVFPTKFVPPSSSSSLSPLQLFSGRKRHIGIVRLTHMNDPGMALVLTDGACLDNGKAYPKAGCAFVQGENLSGEKHVVEFRLETEGPFGDVGLQTSNRAELRAVFGALRFRWWPGEGFHTFVVATDSEYVVEGSTKWARNWVRNNWMTAGGTGVKNRDLWEALLGEVERWKEEGMAVQFWRIPREMNTIADGAAKRAALQPARDKWTDIMGMAV